MTKIEAWLFNIGLAYIVILIYNGFEYLYLNPDKWITFGVPFIMVLCIFFYLASKDKPIQIE
ncbi:MAG: hypothetical protein WCE21_04910 [Candidatus Babeliales bacterium]